MAVSGGSAASQCSWGCRCNWLFQSDGKAILIASGDQCRARCRAVGRIGIGLGESRALKRETIDIWRCVVALPVTTHVGVAEVIRENEDDVRLWRLSPGGATKTCARQCQ